MKLRAFVVMPFGKEVQIPSATHAFGLLPPKQPRVNFDRIYDELIAPALDKVGCQPFRADSEVSAGDIRTDMFFELVTADVVVADLSTLNPNVYYELGVRDGVSPRGVFIVQGGWPTQRPFDVAQDRSFTYNGKLFATKDGDQHIPSADESGEIHQAINDLAKIFSRALASESQGTGSPVYSHLPGLKAANWDDIDTSRAHYFGTLQRNWLERVETAQQLNRPGHIITIAQDAPTRIHRCKILWEAARALIGLCQFAAAEEVLNEMLLLQSDNIVAQMYLGVVHAISGDSLRAEQQLQAILKQHEGNPLVNLTLGFVYRLLWYLEWKHAPDPRERARKSDRLLHSSIRCFYKAQSDHPEQYMGGYNALLLMAVTEDLFGKIELPPGLLDRNELVTVVHYSATSARQIAEETGDHDAQFWTAVALSGLELLKGNKEGTLRAIADACAVPSATRFYLRLLKERACFLQRLQFKTEIVGAVMELVEDALQKLPVPQTWHKVFVYYGYPCDAPGSPERRFPRRSIPEVQCLMNQILDDDWKIGKDDLAICGGMTEGDILFAESCLLRGAHVRLLILDSTDPDSNEWANRRAALLDHPNTTVWYHREELGDPVDTTGLRGRHNLWIFNTARMEVAETAQMEAEGATETADAKTRLYGLILSYGSPNAMDPEEPSYFISRIEAANRHQGRVRKISLELLSKSVRFAAGE